MCELLATVLQTTSVNTLRQVPATNVTFRRSPNTGSLNVRPKKAAAESEPVLRKILAADNPRAVLLIAKTAYDLFKRFHCESRSIKENESRVFTPNGKEPACIFLSAQAWVHGLDRTVPLFMAGHPSKYARRSEWSEVVKALGRGLQQCGVSPIRKSGLSPLEPTASYGTNVELLENIFSADPAASST